ncbi:hypothetical protein OXX59_002901 [Metschnikowia pulcherrima]
MSDDHSQDTRGRTQTSPSRRIGNLDNLGAIPVPKLVPSPIFIHASPGRNRRSSISAANGQKRSLSPARLTTVPFVRQSGSPERRLQIQELESRLLKSASSASSSPKPEPSGYSFKDVKERSISSELKHKPLDKSPKRARFADPPETTENNMEITTPPSSLANTLERVSNTLTATAVSLRDVKETQREILAELGRLKVEVAKLRKSEKSQNAVT